jgi:hypothetical protein
MLVSRRNPIAIPPGVNKDDNAYTSFQWADADKIRFYKSFPQKIGGWQQIMYGNNQTLTGVPRTIWSFIDNNGLEHLLIGTSYGLYSYESGNLYNITPLVPSADAVAIANSLSTNYGLFGNNPITTTVATKTIKVAVSPFAIGLFQVGDFIEITGATGTVGGIAAADINGTFVIDSVGLTSITYQSTSTMAATSTATGGGNAVNLATRVISVSQLAHGYNNGDRVKIVGATAFGGFAIGDINIEAVIRNVSVNAYSYYSTTADTSGHFATSSASGGGGAGTTVQGQIAAGNCMFISGIGYGGGLYGQGKYGTPRSNTGGTAIPQIWSFASYTVGSTKTVLMTPGNQGGLYQWQGSNTVAPVLLTGNGTPTAINYVTMMNNQVVVFGADGIVNNIASTNDVTNWSVTDATVTAFSGNLTGAGRLLTSEYCKGQNIVFTGNSVHRMTFVGAPDTWLLDDIMVSDGVLGPQCSTTVQDNIVWAGQNNFYMYNGAIAQVIPGNTLNEWFFSNLGEPTAYHSFAHKSQEFNEIWWFAPFGASEEPSDYVIWNWQEGHWTNGALARTASEEPTNPLREQVLAFGQCNPAINGVLYLHEAPGDYSDNGNPMSGSLTSNDSIIDTGEYMQEILRIIPSITLLPLGTTMITAPVCNMYIFTKEYDSAPFPRSFGPYNIISTTQKIEARANGRQRQYKFVFDNTTGFRLEKFFEELRTTTPR